jgi:hypothetical protein
MVGFDFPIGLPSSYAKRTGFTDFPQALLHFGEGEWASWFEVAERADDISIRRPFYPLRPGGTRRSHLISAHDVHEAAALLRHCELSTPDRAAACSLFWTLGGNQVGKAAITGWREIIKPNLSQDGVCLWPFDGDLPQLIQSCRQIIVETYPGEVYRHLGIPRRPAWSKRKKEGRRSAAVRLRTWISERPVVVAPELITAIGDGFGDGSSGEDQFDAVVGLFGMIDVATGIRPDGAPQDDDVRRWEGWILGQSSVAG